MYSVQVEEGLHPFLQRIGQASAPFVRPWAETLVKSTSEFANATLNININCQIPIIVKESEALKRLSRSGTRGRRPPLPIVVAKNVISCRILLHQYHS